MLPNRFVGLSWTGPEPGAVQRVRKLGWRTIEAPGLLLAAESALPDAGIRKPPFRTIAASQDAVVAETDHWGLGHIFLVRGGGVSALGSSATLLAQIFGVEPDTDALMDFALFGCFTGTSSAFSGVSKLPAGHRAIARDGGLTLERWFEPQPARGDVRETFVAAVAALAASSPDAELELSGGLDSRLILAAMPPGERRRHVAYTIGEAASGDVRVAAAIAQDQGLAHRIVSLADLSMLDGDALEQLLCDAALGYDLGANPVDKAPLVYASARGGETGARFGGQNGEILRGFYYPGQPIQRMPDAALADRLIDWRLIANDRVMPSLFDGAAYTAHRRRATEAMRARLMGYGGTWGQTLDRFYLDERMQRWVGIGTGNRFVSRRLLYPFFDPDFVAAAMALRPAEKMGSRAAYRLLACLDSHLAEVPLDNGVIPARPGKTLGGTIAKVVAKLRQRLGGASRPTLGSGAIGALWHRHRLFERLDRDALASFGFFDARVLDAILRGEVVPDRATLGFLVLLSGVKEALRCDPR